MAVAVVQLWLAASTRRDAGVGWQEGWVGGGLLDCCMEGLNPDPSDGRMDGRLDVWMLSFG